MTAPIEGYFGPPVLRKSYERQIEAPVGTACLLCKETIVEADTGNVNGTGQTFHYECQMRAIVGSVGHQLARCSCFGGTEEDPPGMTAREAAKAAAKLWHDRQAED
jgi:hypothetical protein